MNRQLARFIYWPGWLWLPALAFLLLPSFASAQTVSVPFEQGDHAFRFVLKQFDFQPLSDVKELHENADTSILIVFGDTQILDQLPRGLQSFLDKGGAVLVATDRDVGRKWQEELGTPLREHYVSAPRDLGLAYRNNPECPFVVPTQVQDPPVFKNLHEVATNRPRYLVNNSQTLKTLAVFDPGCRLEGPFQWPSICPFAVGGEIGKGRVLVLSDHSVFINAMMIPTDNDNFDFAYRCLDWLSDRGEGQDKRSHVLFINEAETITTFDVPVTDVPLPTMELINQLLVKMEQENLFNRLILGEHPEQRFRAILQGLIVALTTALIGFGCYRFLLARHVVETKEPLFAAKAAQQTPNMALTTQRQLAMIKSDNFWEAAHHLARDWFLATLPDSLSEARMAGLESSTASVAGASSRRGLEGPATKGAQAVQPGHPLRSPRGPSAHATRPAAILRRFSVDAGRWRRRSWEKKLRLVWNIAVGPPVKLSASEFARFVTQLDEIKAALAKGTLALKTRTD
jgi:hypothetical protein